MPVNPRIMVVNTVSTFNQEEAQSVDLTLLDRVGSLEFYSHFSGRGSRNISDVLEYARMHATACIGRPGVSFCHRRAHQYTGIQYHLGDVITEEEAARELGYVEPYIDTIAARIAEASRSDQAGGMSINQFTDFLRHQKLISEDYSALRCYSDVHVVANHMVNSIDIAPRIKGQNNADRAITLFIFEQGADGEVPVGVGYYVAQKNTTYEFMTYIPVAKDVRV